MHIYFKVVTFTECTVISVEQEMEKYTSELIDETSVDKSKFVNSSADRDVFLWFLFTESFISINLVYLKGDFHLFNLVYLGFSIWQKIENYLVTRCGRGICVFYRSSLNLPFYLKKTQNRGFFSLFFYKRLGRGDKIDSF